MTRPGQPRRPARRRPVADPARRAAFDLLREVAGQDAYANLVLPGLLRRRRLSARDAAFATQLGYGALRAQGTLDAVLARCVDRPLAEVDPPLLDALRLGAYQLVGMRVPTHAAVSATVDLVRIAVGPGPGGFANAVLRRVARQDRDAWLAEVAPPAATDPLGHLAVTEAHPRWVAGAFADALGGDLEQASLALAADNVAPLVHLAARPGRIGRDELLAASGPGAQAGPWSPYAVRLADGDPAAIAAVRQGRAGVQDEGSQLVALAVAAAPVDGRDERWLDLCAGPGGKAALLSGLAAQRGAALLALDVSAHRAALVAGALAGTDRDAGGPPGRPAPEARSAALVADGTVPPFPPGSMDRVLVDAPCTGLGALRRRPEARWRRRPADVPRLAALQRALLATAADLLRPGGVLVYATCSPHLAETRLVVEDVRCRREDLDLLDARSLLPGLPGLGDGPFVQLWPHRHGTDAMFLAALRRTGPGHAPPAAGGH